MFLLIDKPADWTSHDVIAYLRRITREKKIGHAGTLDPFATGLLIVGVGKAATTRLDAFKGMPKTYEATLCLGETSSTGDSTGELTATAGEVRPPTEAEIDAVLASFIGTQEQIPPMYSAKKVDGKKLYDLARSGVTVERKPSVITIYTIERLGYSYPFLTLSIHCSTGTYIRTLAEDIGAALGTGGYCHALRRTQIGPYHVDAATQPKAFSRETWRDAGLSDIPHSD